MRYELVYCHSTDKRIRPIVSLIPSRAYNYADILEAKARVKISSQKKYRYFPSAKYLNLKK